MTASLARRLHVAILLALTATPQLAGESTDFGKLLERTAPALVTVQLVLQVKTTGSMGQLIGDSQGFETETVCTVIDAQGLILCSNTQTTGYMGIMQRVMGHMGAQSDLAVTPTQIRVLVAGETKPFTAKLLVRDTDLDLAWLQIENGGDRSFAFVDFAQNASPGAGDLIFAIRRLDKFFDRAPSLLEARVSSITQKPRALIIPTAGFETSLGIPVLTTSGQAIGVLVLQLPDESESSSRPGLSLEMMGWSSRMQDIGRGVVLPAADVVKATRKALASLPEETPKKD